MEPDDPLDGAGSLLEEAGTLVLVSQRAEERFVLQLPDDADVNRGKQHHEGARQLGGENVETGPEVPLVVPWLHLHPPTEADVLEESGAGVGAKVVVTNQNAHLPFQ